MDSNISSFNNNHNNSSQNITQFRRVLRHINYVTYLSTIQCYEAPLYSLTSADSCNYVRSTRSCNEVVETINYLDLVMCVLHAAQSVEGIFLTIIIALAFYAFYLSFLCIITQFFLVPNLVVIFRQVGLPEYEFGITLLTIFFSFPSTLRSFLKCDSVHQSGSLLLSSHIGKLSGFYAYGFIALSMSKRYAFGGIRHMRNALLSVLGLFYIYQLLHFHEFRESTEGNYEFDLRLHAWICLLIYAAFITFMLIHSRMRSIFGVLRRPNRWLKKRKLELGDISSDEQLGTTTHLVKQAKPWILLRDIINPFRNMRAWPMYIKVLCFPQFTLLAFLIPVVDTSRQMNGWCLLIACLSLLLFPFECLLLGISNYEFAAVFALVSIIVFFILLLTNRKRIPSIHDAFAAWGLFVSFFICNICSAELDVIVWQFASFLEDWSGDIVKLAFYSLGDHVLEVLLTVALIRNGNENMAYGLIVGLCMYMVYIPLPSLVLQFCFNHDDVISITANTETCFIFMMIIMVTTTLGVAISDFQLRPSHGIYLIIFYHIFMFYLYLSEQWVIHPYGSSHAVLMLEQTIQNTWA